MRVATWNLWWTFGPWRERQPAIEATVAAVAADIWLFQEVVNTPEYSQAKRIAELNQLNHIVAEAPDGSPRQFTNAVLSRFPVVEHQTVSLPHLDSEPAARHAILARLATPWGHQVVVSTHLAWQYDRSELRERQLAALVSAISDFAPLESGEDHEASSGWPAVIGADLNAVPESPEVQRLTGVSRPYLDGVVFTDAWAVAGDGPGLTWSRSNPHRNEAQWPERRVDYIFVGWPRAKPFGNALSAELIGVTPIDGVVASDHYGVVVDLDHRRREP